MWTATLKTIGGQSKVPVLVGISVVSVLHSKPVSVTCNSDDKGNDWESKSFISLSCSQTLPMKLVKLPWKSYTLTQRVASLIFWNLIAIEFNGCKNKSRCSMTSGVNLNHFQMEHTLDRLPELFHFFYHGDQRLLVWRQIVRVISFFSWRLYQWEHSYCKGFSPFSWKSPEIYFVGW